MKKVFFLLIIVLMTACSQLQPITIERIPFDLSEFTSLQRTGDATVKGQAYIKTTDGEVHYAKTAQARLNPITTYSKQWYKINYIERKNIADADPRYLSYVYKADFDDKGHFIFNNVPAGDYYISAPIYWIKEIKMEDGSVLMKRLGSFVCFKIHVDKGNTLITNITTGQPDNVALSQ